MNKLRHNHQFHLVTLSPWPIITSIRLIIILIGIIKWLTEFYLNMFLLGLVSLIINILQWWRDVVRERTYQGTHTKHVHKLIQIGIILFIISEIFFFLSFFWAFFHNFLSPRIEIGRLWPPKILIIFNPYRIPLINTIILLTSGITITWSHYKILNRDYNESSNSLKITIFLGIIFTLIQYKEYCESFFTISDSIFGRIFFIITGFHGLHVIIGTIFIIISYLRLKNLQFSSNHHFGFEACSWYWHFVDVIWLLVYILLYWIRFYFYSIKLYI